MAEHYKHRDPVPWGGYKPDVEEAIRSAVLINEIVTAGPFEFQTPAACLSFPDFSRLSQGITQLVLTDKAFYTIAVRADPAMVTGSTRVGLGEIVSVKKSISKRMNRVKREPVVDWVLLIVVAQRDGTVIAAESRFIGASAFVDAVNQAVAQAHP